MDEKLEERKRLIEDPHKYVMESLENELMFVGEKAGAVLSLIPCSLILPDIEGASKIRSNINLFILANAGSGKSSLCNKFANFTYFPLQVRNITPAHLSFKAIEMGMMSLIIEDFSQIVENGYELVKVIEGIIGDEKNVLKSNRVADLSGKVQAVCMMAGTPSDMIRYLPSLEGGLFSRFVLVLISHTADQHSKIGEYINTSIGSQKHSQKVNLMNETVINYYKELFTIQEGKHPQIKPIKGFEIDDSIKQKIYTVWEKITHELVKSDDTAWIRELHEGYRFLVAHAFLNVFNRKIENGILYPNEKDLEVATKLMKQNLKYKWAISQSMSINRKIKSVDMLRSILNSGGIPEAVKNILINISPYSSALKLNDKFEENEKPK